MKTFYQIFSIQIDTVLSEYTTKHFSINKTYGMNFLANTMASRIFSTKEVVSFLMEDVVTEFDNPYEPLVEGSYEEFEYLEEQNDSGRKITHIYVIKQQFYRYRYGARIGT